MHLNFGAVLKFIQYLKKISVCFLFCRKSEVIRPRLDVTSLVSLDLFLYGKFRFNTAVSKIILDFSSFIIFVLEKGLY